MTGQCCTVSGKHLEGCLQERNVQKNLMKAGGADNPMKCGAFLSVGDFKCFFLSLFVQNPYGLPKHAVCMPLFKCNVRDFSECVALMSILLGWCAKGENSWEKETERESVKFHVAIHWISALIFRTFLT